ncbi:hypothetical protein EDD29_4657 [Actinocorallia herbida]|uniref:Uncharacterized protein n=1 Tax=Actinocorallia herbida TaxID=58109 RepID=A0A3N1D1X8_9ACTN|nr:hypothetical protein EDD29_4657 [Actinocorallia herbida]
MPTRQNPAGGGFRRGRGRVGSSIGWCGRDGRRVDHIPRRAFVGLPDGGAFAAAPDLLYNYDARTIGPLEFLLEPLITAPS